MLNGAERAPSAFGRLEQSDRTADVEFALPVELRYLRRQVDAGILGGEGLQPAADPLSQLLRQREVASREGAHSNGLASIYFLVYRMTFVNCPDLQFDGPLDGAADKVRD